MANLAHTVQGSLASSISSVRKQNNNYMIMRLPHQFYRSLKIAYFCLKNFLFLPILKKILLVALLAHKVQGSLASGISSARKQDNNYRIMGLFHQAKEEPKKLLMLIFTLIFVFFAL